MVVVRKWMSVIFMKVIIIVLRFRKEEYKITLILRENDELKKKVESLKYDNEIKDGR